LNDKLSEGLTSLVDTAIEEDAPDNITAIAIRIVGPLETLQNVKSRKDNVCIT
jgi:protein phosphatase